MGVGAGFCMYDVVV